MQENSSRTFQGTIVISLWKAMHTMEEADILSVMVEKLGY